MKRVDLLKFLGVQDGLKLDNGCWLMTRMVLCLTPLARWHNISCGMYNGLQTYCVVIAIGLLRRRGLWAPHGRECARMIMVT